MQRKMSRVDTIGKSVYRSIIEQAMLGGKISPPSGIFLMKNWLSYKDAISIEESIPNKETKRVLSAAELPKLGDATKKQGEDLPKLGMKLDYGEGENDI